MDLALGSAAGAQDVDLQAAAFEFGIEPALLLDPHADLILDANPAACTLLGYDRALLRQTKVSTLHAGQLPALIVFTQAVLDKGAFKSGRGDINQEVERAPQRAWPGRGQRHRHAQPDHPPSKRHQLPRYVA
jgi:PAS domain-containing protein